MGTKLKVTVKETNVFTFDSGDLPKNLIKELLDKNEGSFDGNWGLYDVTKGPDRTIDSIVVEDA